MTAESTVNAIMDQLLDSKFEAFIDRFTDNNCSTFTDDAEFKLGYTDIHQQYVRIYESRIESQLKKEGVSREQFSELCVKVQDSDPSYGIFLEVLASVDSFEHFVDMMRAKRRELE